MTVDRTDVCRDESRHGTQECVRHITMSAMEQDRRAFLGTALAAAPLFIPRRAWGANDRLAYGLIGAGGRGRYLNRNFQKLGAACVAVSEVYEPNMQAALKDAPDAKPHLDYHDLLAQSGIDAVVVACLLYTSRCV